MIRRLFVGLLGVALALAGSLVVVTAPAGAQQCAANDPYDHMHYTFYWYECRRAETPNPSLLPRIDPATGQMTMCVDNSQNGALPLPIGGQDGKLCVTADLAAGTPQEVCTPDYAVCQRVPGLFDTDDPTPEYVNYESFRLCDSTGTQCRSTFLSQCAGSTTETWGCVGAGVEFYNQRDATEGAKQVCIGVGTPMNRPGTWMLLCTKGVRGPNIHT